MTRLAARESRSFLQRAVRFLAEEARVGQFLDIGGSLPTTGSTHEIAQRRVPHARIVYVAPKPGAPPAGAPEGRIAIIAGDPHDPTAILAHPQIRSILDLSLPVAIILTSALQVIPDQRQARDIIRELLAALSSGSYLAATSPTLDFTTPADAISATTNPARPRTRAEFAELFTGLGLIGPGIVPVSEWLPEVPAHQRPPAEQVAVYGALGRKP